MRAAPTSRSLLNPARWLIGFRSLFRRWVRAGCAPLRPGAAWRRGKRGGRQRATLAGVERFHPALYQLEDRFYPGDPTGLQYAALWGAGAGLLLPSMALTANVSDPGLPAAGDVSVSASALAFTAPDQPAAGGSNIAQADVAPGSTPDSGTPALTTTATTQLTGAEPWADPLGPALAAALATTPVAAPAGPAAPSPGAVSGGTAGAAAVFSPASGSLAAASPALGSPSPAGPTQLPSPTPPSAPAGGPARGTSPLPASPASAAAPSLAPAAGAAPAASVPGQPAGSTPSVLGHPSLDQAFAHVPLAFEPNVGQVSGPSAGQVQFLAHGPGYSLFLTGNAAVLSLARPGSPGIRDVVKEQFVGADPSAQFTPDQQLSSYSNYFTGSDPSAWHTDVPQYSQVTEQGLYPGIDARYYGNGQGQLEYDLTVAPGADPAAIRLQVQGASGLQLDGQGNLLVQTGGGPVVQQAPALYQMRDGVKQAVSGRYTLGGDGSIGFQPGAYDHALPLVIDPTLNFGSYLGGSGNDSAYGVAVDPAGNVYLTGQTYSSNFPVTTGTTLGSPSDAFVTKFYASGSALIYSTYLGGTGSDVGNAIAVDAAGNAYVAGQASSSNFPVSSGAYQSSKAGSGGTGFFAKLNVTGDAVLYASYFGSTSGTVTGAATGVAVDAAGNAYVTGDTSSGTSFPTTSGAYQTSGGGGYDAWVARFNPNASGSSSLVYSTLLGGSADDKGLGIAIDSSGDAYVTGSTGNPSGGAGFPTTAGAYLTSFGSGTTKGFVTEVNPTGTGLVYSTLLGGTGTDQGNALAVNLSGNAYVTGTASSTNFPTTTGAYQTTSGGGNDAFVTELNTTGTGLAYSTYLGGGGNDEGYGLAVDSSGDAFVAGETASTNFPTASALQSSNGGGNDAFLTEVNPSGAGLVYSTYLGGSSDDAAQAVALDLAGNAYVAGWTNSSNFPTGGTPYQSSSGGSTDAFLAKIGAVPNPPVFTAISPDTGSSSSDQITTSQNLTLSGTAAKSATVTVSRSGVGVLGSVTANATTGAWSYDYSGTTLAEGTYAFTGTTTVSGLTSPPSSPFLVTVDRTAPALTLTVPASTASKKPQVLVAASDLNGLPDGTTVTLDVDTNNDGNFTDSGETGYATGTLKDGSALITLPTLPSTGTYPVRARVTDLAGNQGTSATQNIVVSSVTAWSLASAAVLTSDPLTGDSQDQLGDVQVSAPLDLDQSPGTTQSGDPALVYNSDGVTGAPVLQVAVQAPNNISSLPQLQAQLTWNGVPQSAQTFYIPSTAGPGSVLVLGVLVPAVSSTGRDGWSVTVTPQGGSGMTTSGSTFIVVQTGSTFGAGWTLSNMDQLVSIAADSYGPAGMLREYGTGEWRFYASAGGGSYTSPAGDNGTLSSSGGAYTYTTPDGQTWNFNSSGQETSWVSPDGHQTLAFSYSSGQLSTLTAIDGAVTTFSYSGSLVSTMQTGSRTVTLTYSGSDLSQVTNPDGGVHTFTYSGSHLLSGDQLGGVQDSWSYASFNTLATYTWGGPQGSVQSPSQTAYSPALLQGLGTGSSTAAVGPARATVTDALGHKTLWQLDSQGRPLQETQPNGGVWVWTRDSNGRVTVQTDPLHRVTTIQYDSSGYPTQVTQPDGSTLGYQYQSSFHALTQSIDERGHATTFTYDSQGHPLTMVNALNQTTTFGWTTSGLLQTVTDPLGHTTTFQYDSDRRLTESTDPLGNATQYTYDSNGNPRTTTDALSRVTTTAYDAMSRLTQITDALGNTQSWAYNAAGLLTQATDQRGHVTSVTYDSFSRGLPYLQSDAAGTPAQAIWLYTYDADGRLSTPRDTNGYTTSKGYDAQGNLIQQTNPMGGVQKAAYDLAGEQTGTRDELGRWTFSQYNSRGWVTAVTDPLGNATTYAYDQAGDLTAVTDPLNHTMTYQYDALNRSTVQTDALGHSLTTTYDAAGNVSTVTDALGNVTSYTYDAANELVTETDAVGTSLQRTATLAYDAVGNVTAATDPLGHTTDYAYDQLNRPTAVTDPLGHTTTLSYDAAGNLTSSQDALGKTTDYAYDAQNRAVSVTDPLGHTVTTAYDAMGNAVAVTDALGHTTVTGYDPLQDPLVTVDALGGVTRVVYDAAGNPVAVTDPVGNQTGFVYDGLNRVAEQINPQGYATTVAYDAAGRETSTTDADGRVQNFTYDAANRLTGGTWVTSGSTVNTLTYTYDANSNLLTAGDASGTYTLTYDALDRLATDQNLYGLTLTYSYDAADRVTQVQDPKGGITTSVYDAADRLTTREFGGTGQTPLRVDLSYDNRNDLTGVTRSSDLAGTQVVGTTAYSYDDASRVTAIVNKDASSATLSYYDYSYDAADRVTSQTWQSGSTPGSATYTYDATDQLLSDGTHTYSYDLNGNRTMSGYQTGTDNRLTTDGVWTYTYDNAGNEIEKSKGSGLETWYYTYDTLNRLTNVRQTSDGSTNEMVATYTYDVFGDRVQQAEWTASTGTVTARFQYDAAGNVWADTDTSNNVEVRYLYGDGVDQLFARTEASGQANPGVAWYLTDALGSVRDLMDSTGTIRDHLDYDGFGNPTESNASFGDRYKYTGREYDSNTGLQFNRARYYDAKTGRWLSQDPLSFGAGDSNLYRYVANDPPNLRDPFGLIAPSQPPTGGGHMVGGHGGPAIAMTDTGGIGAIGPGPKPVDPTVSGTYHDPLSNFGDGLWTLAASTLSPIERDILTAPLTGTVLDGTDRLFAGWANRLTLGATNRIRSRWYGETATRNHHGTLYAIGSGIGTAHGVLIVIAGILVLPEGIGAVGGGSLAVVGGGTIAVTGSIGGSLAIAGGLVGIGYGILVLESSGNPSDPGGSDPSPGSGPGSGNAPLSGQGMAKPEIMRNFFTGKPLANTPENVDALRWYLQIARNVLAKYKQMGYQGPGVATQTQRIQQILDQLAQWGVAAK